MGGARRYGMAVEHDDAIEAEEVPEVDSPLDSAE